MSITPAEELIRCSMDWTQELQVIPSTPRVTPHRLPLSVMVALHTIEKLKNMTRHESATNEKKKTTEKNRKTNTISLKMRGR